MISPNLNADVASLETPAIPLAHSWADEYSGVFGPLIDLSQAVPNYPPHEALLSELAQAALDPELCGYGLIEGEPKLRKVYAAHINKQYQSDISIEQTHITSGCNQAFFACLLAISARGSTVLTTNPCYFNHAATASVLGFKLKNIDCDSENGFLPLISSVERAIDQSVSVIALVSPNNPTGAIYPPGLLSEIFELCRVNNIWLILDETYRDFAPTSLKPYHALLNHPNWENNLIQLCSFSKTFCIPGHRLGAIVAGTRVVKAVAKVMDNMQICSPRVAQHALANQMDQLKNWIDGNREKINQRVATFVEVFNAFPQWKIKSLGGYFAYVEHPYSSMDSRSLVKLMASKYGVLPLPGSFFGEDQDGYVRMAFANVEIETIKQLAPRLAKLQADDYR